MTFEYTIDGGTTRQVMAAIASALKFPDYFGYNLDALYDCLTDLSWLPDGEHVLIWSKPGALRDTDATAYDAIATVLADAVADGTGGGAYLSVRLQAD
ncbi:barstar family protein [Nonomuraea sp. NPDC046570]|uniref:barstar family protein n=1 Tax=Nonomuraea sp. NPDC046570 TaxID=3155255 RepID=UPI0033C5B107